MGTALSSGRMRTARPLRKNGQNLHWVPSALVPVVVYGRHLGGRSPHGRSPWDWVWRNPLQRFNHTGESP